MNKKRLIAIISSIALVTTLFAGCAAKPATTPAPAATSSKPGASIKIGLSTDEGGLNDKSFNQSADTGVKRAVADFGVQYKAVESKLQMIMSQI